MSASLCPYLRALLRKVCFQASSESLHNSFLFAYRTEVPVVSLVLILKLLSTSRGHYQAPAMWSLPLSLCLEEGKPQFLLSANLIRSGPSRYLSFDEREASSLITHSGGHIPSQSWVLLKGRALHKACAQGAGILGATWEVCHHRAILGGVMGGAESAQGEVV